MMGLHAFCCGFPALAMLTVTLGGALSGFVAVAGFAEQLHSFMHAHELWILALSAALVLSGGWFEAQARSRGRRGMPWLFAVSVLCFVANLVIIAAHRV